MLPAPFKTLATYLDPIPETADSTTASLCGRPFPCKLCRRLGSCISISFLIFSVSNNVATSSAPYIFSSWMVCATTLSHVGALDTGSFSFYVLQLREPTLSYSYYYEERNKLIPQELMVYNRGLGKFPARP